MDIPTNNLSPERVKYYRKDNGWSQEVLAKASGLSLRTIQRVEKDGSSSVETQLSLAAAFNVSSKILFPVSSTPDVYWKRKIFMQNIFALFVVSAAISMLLMLAGDFGMFSDVYSALFLVLYTYAATVISFGSSGLIKSIKGLSYIFASEVAPAPATRYLALIISKQIWFIYGASFIAALVGLIAIYSNIGNITSDAELYASYAVNILIILYAAIIAEGVFRPLAIKLSSADAMATMLNKM